jgi:WD40 repeat protein
VCQHSTDSYGGPVWSLAVDPAGEHLAAACDEGIRLFDISYGDIQLKKTFNKAGKGQLICASACVRLLCSYTHLFHRQNAQCRLE